MKYLKILLLYLVSGIFQVELQLLLYVVLAPLLLQLPSVFQGKFLRSEHHLYIGTVLHPGEVGLSVKAQQAPHE